MVTYGFIDSLQSLFNDGAGHGQIQALGVVNNLVTQQAFMISTQEIFYGSAILFISLIALVWLARRTHGGAGADAAAGAH